MVNGYDTMNPYSNYGDGKGLSPYELLMQMKSWNKAIYLTMENSDKEIKTQLSVLDGEIRQNILDVKNGLETNISTTAAGLQANITNTASGLQTQITANAQGVASKVSKTDYNGNTVASLIAQTPTAVSVVAQALNLSGYVTFSSLTASGTTNIDGARITTGLISADRIQASMILSKLIQAGGIDASHITSGTISASRLSADAIRSTLIWAGGISADMITSGYISADRISGGTITGVMIRTSRNIVVGSTLNVGEDTIGARINLGTGNYIQAASDASIAFSASRLNLVGYGDLVYSRTSGLSLGFDSSTKKLYVSINGIDRAVFIGT